MKNSTILLLLIILIVAYYFNSISSTEENGKNYTIPSEYINSGSKGLTYIESQYASEMAQARSLCESQFEGRWVETSTNLGCYDMESFSSIYCNLDAIKQIVDLCRSIGGNPTCSSNQASCTV